MAFPVHPAPGDTPHELMSHWSQQIYNALQGRYPEMSVVRLQREGEWAVSLRNGVDERGEVVVRWLPAGELSIFAQSPPLRTPAPDASGWAGRAMGLALALVTVAWIAFLFWFWDIFWEIRGVRGKVFWLLVLIIGWLASTFGAVFGAEAAAKRLHALLHRPQPRIEDPWVQGELWAAVQQNLNELWRRAQADAILARRLGLRFDA